MAISETSAAVPPDAELSATAETDVAAPGSDGPSPSLPEGTRLYVVGDIHGCAELLRMMHRLILADAARATAKRQVVVYLGDYIDRGPDSKGVVDLLVDSPLPGFESIHLKGNHEQALLEFLNDISIGPDWFSFGGIATFASYGLMPPANIFDAEALMEAQAALRATLSEAHLRFYNELRLGYLEGDFLMVHAGLRPGVPLDAQTEGDVLWIRDPFLGCDANFGVVVVHGHTIAVFPEVRPNRIGIDTGAFHTGRLTCLVLQGKEINFLQT
jgi:serine/threonine protein phosphatase 1